MAAVKYFKSTGETEELLYSTDEGEKWSSLKFVNQTIRVYNLMTEPGENTTWFTVFGSKIDKHGWMIINVDLKNAFCKYVGSGSKIYSINLVLVGCFLIKCGIYFKDTCFVYYDCFIQKH